jgi:uncharacterized protein YbcI
MQRSSGGASAALRETEASQGHTEARASKDRKPAYAVRTKGVRSARQPLAQLVLALLGAFAACVLGAPEEVRELRVVPASWRHLGHADRLGLELQELTNAMVRLYKELFGRGPTKARTNYAGPDTLVATIENSLTPAERNMIDLGEHQRVREIRMFFQHASDTEFTGTVEEITGRKVRAFVSGMDTEEDVATEVFYLEPVPSA